MGVIVVTAPTGAIGRQLVDRLLAADAKLRIVARDPSKLSAHVHERAEIVPGSHGDAAVIDKALAGASAVFWLPPPNPKATSLEAIYTDFTWPAADAIRRHKVGHVVSVSALGRGTPLAANAGHVTGSLAMDDMLAATGAAFRALTMPSFFDNVLRQAALIKDKGMFTGVIDGDRKSPFCATSDIAGAAAKLLLDLSWTGQSHVAVLGPENLSFNDMAKIMSEVLNKPVRYQQVPFDAHKARLIEFGMSEAMAQGVIDMMKAKNAGLDDGEPRTAQNTTPTSFRKWCETVLVPAVKA